jgi:hypothetical protein
MALVHFMPRAILTGAALWLQGLAVAADFSLRTNDVIAFVGGEDIVTMQEFGYVELFLAQETLKKGLRFRNLGWEGDTVFEQKRDLNFPSWEQTLDKIGATVVIAQFGQAESLRETVPIPEFRAAAERFFLRLAGTNRHLVLLAPTGIERTGGSFPDFTPSGDRLSAITAELRALAQHRAWTFVGGELRSKANGFPFTRDGLHLDSNGHKRLASELVTVLGAEVWQGWHLDGSAGVVVPAAAEQLRQAILAKNRLWFNYWRPQNWAFLAGDRTEQPSSRDHRDPKIRWFPGELEKFVPLIEAKENEIARIVASLPLGGSGGLK